MAMAAGELRWRQISSTRAPMVAVMKAQGPNSQAAAASAK